MHAVITPVVSLVYQRHYHRVVMHWQHRGHTLQIVDVYHCVRAFVKYTMGSHGRQYVAQQLYDEFHKDDGVLILLF
jgi:hypothetical protein